MCRSGPCPRCFSRDPAGKRRGHGPLLPQIRTDQRDGGVDSGVVQVRIGRGLRQRLAQVAFQHFRHQSVDRAAYGSELLQYRGAIRALFQRTLERVELATDAAHAGEGFLLVGGRVGHAGCRTDTAGEYMRVRRRMHVAPQLGAIAKFVSDVQALVNLAGTDFGERPEWVSLRASALGEAL